MLMNNKEKSSETNSQTENIIKYIDNKENKENYENYEKEEDIISYLNALSFFAKIKTISDYNLPYYNSIEHFIKYFKKYNINPQKEDDYQKISEKEYLRNNPHKIFSFFLDELHKVFKDVEDSDNDNENKQKIKAVEYDSQAAKKLFMDYMEEDKSYISETFFGCKKIIKLCKNCGLTQYIL